ncbi:hypothetical protein ACHWQZ_G017140 [Mnemiopsis leidyi]
MIINALTSVGRSYEETRNVTITLATLIGLIFIVSVQNPVFVLYLWLFSGGMAIGVFVLQRYVTPPSIWIFGYLFKLKYTPYRISPVPTVKYVQCPICDKQNCRRHEVQVKSDQIWKGIMIPEKIDEKIEEFCQLLLVHHIYYWYHPISQNTDFLHDVRCIFRFIAASLIRICMQLDIGKIVTEKLIPLGVVHLENHVKTKQKYPGVTDRDELAELTLQEYGDNLHIALTSENNENRYLRSLVELLLPYLVPESRLSAPKANTFIRELVSMVMLKTGVDLVADADFINLLIRMLLDPETMKEHKDPPSKKVELLANFVGGTTSLQTSQYYKLEDLLFNQTNLYSFMQYLRKQGAINLLQCCLTVKEKIDTFSTTSVDSEIRFTGYKNDIRAFYDLYFANDASDKIEFPSEITEELKSSLLVKYSYGLNPFKGVLQKVYVYLMEHMRSNYCVGFYQSDYFFLLLLGDRVVPPPKLSSWSKVRKESAGGLGAMFSTLKDKLSNNPMDPMLEMLDDSALSAAQLAQITTSTGSALLGVETDDVEQVDYNAQSSIDLSKWSININNTELLGEWLRQYVAYVIDVTTDVKKLTGGFEHLTVKRRFSEFVMLHKRLRKFHGSLGGLQLPQRKSMNALNSEFIMYRRQELGIYLQKLLRMDYIRHSELIAKFLSPSCDDFNKIAFISMPKQAIGSAGEFAGKMMSGVRPKEKSLYLYPFLKSVCKSVTPGYCGNSHTGSSEVGSNPSTPMSTPTMPRKNAAPSTSIEAQSASSALQRARDMQGKVKVELNKRQTHDNTIFMQLTGVTECVLYAALLLGDLPNLVIHALCSVLLVIKNTLDHFVISFINFKINLVLQEKEVVEIIELARDVLFFDEEVRGPDQIKERADMAKSELIHKIPNPIKKLLGKRRIDDALLTIYHGLQNKRLNKQLVYTLLDVFLGEVLSELREREDILIQQDGADEPALNTPE